MKVKSSGLGVKHISIIPFFWGRRNPTRVDGEREERADLISR